MENLNSEKQVLFCVTRCAGKSCLGFEQGHGPWLLVGGY
jgi:hypothetical protein